MAISVAGSIPAGILFLPGRPLLADQRTRTHVLDVQRGKFAAGHWSVPRSTHCYSGGKHLDGARPDCMVHLRSHSLRRVLELAAGAHRRFDSGNVCPLQSASRSHSLGVCAGLVLYCASNVALDYAGGNECQRGAKGPGRLGARLYQLLEVLARLDAYGSSGVMGTGESVFAAVATIRK